MATSMNAGSSAGQDASQDAGLHTTSPGFPGLFSQLGLPWSPLILCATGVWLYMLRRWSSKTAAVSASATSKTPSVSHQNTGAATRSSKPDWTTLDFSKTEPIAPDFDWATTDERPYRPWPDGPHHVTMGIQKSALDDWVEIDKTYLDRYTYKRHLYATYPEETIRHLPRSEDAAHEALEYLADLLPRRYPTMFAKTAVGVRNEVTGDDWDLRRGSATWATHHPLQVMGLLSTEDWFIMQTEESSESNGEEAATTRLVAGANCFPAGWKLSERIGHSLWEIHAGRVPMYEKNLARSMDRFFLRVRADQPYMRFNYAIDVDKELFHIHSHHNLTVDDAQARTAGPVTLDQLHLRVERQVLQRLPRSGAIAFSIRTYVTPITTVTQDRERARALRTNVASYSPLVAQYKNKALWEDVLAKHLDEVIGPEEGDSAA